RTTQYLTSLSVVLVGMDFMLQLALMGNLFRVFGSTPGSMEVTTLEASRNPMRRQIANPTRPTRGTLTSMTRGVRRGWGKSRC
uniref:Uncharacterized protein n=1 Tax=Aegilops tauschii subsp. strangulata TaxID=200361 RepID=A0A453SDE1_AEGTS